MERQASFVREFGKIVQDGFWPNNDETFYPNDNQRYCAMAHVLCNIPEEDYQGLKKNFDHKWFVPGEIENGRTFSYRAKSESRLSPQLVKIIYLSPSIERMPSYGAIAIVAHELAHVANGLQEECSTLEEEGITWELVCKWGFKQEAMKHLVYQFEHVTTPQGKDYYKKMIEFLTEGR